VFEEPALGESLYLFPSESQRSRMMSQTLLQDVIVLQVGNFAVEGPVPQQVVSEQPQEAAPVENQQPTPPAVVEDTRPPDVITLIVSPQDAVTLNYLLYTGAAYPGVEGANDDTRIQTEAVTLQYLLTQYNIPVPVKLPYGVEPASKNCCNRFCLTMSLYRRQDRNRIAAESFISLISGAGTLAKTEVFARVTSFWGSVILKCWDSEWVQMTRSASLL
jgi:hypothetical protein